MAPRRHRPGLPPSIPQLPPLATKIRISIRFVPTSSFRPRHVDDLRGERAVHASHDLDVLLSVWDPVTDELRDLPRLPLTLDPFSRNWDAAVVSAAGDDGHGHGHFKVVFVGNTLVSVHPWSFSCFYSSEASSDSWSHPVFAIRGRRLTGGFVTGTCVHVGSVLYFMSACNYELFKYDLRTNMMSILSLSVGPGVGMNSSMGMVLTATEDGWLGVAWTSNSTLRLCLREHGRWEERRAIELATLLPPEAFGEKPCVAGFAETRAGGVIFLRTCVGYFAVNLNSGRSQNIGECLGGWGRIIPYVSFCTPAPGAVFKDEGPGAVMFSKDEGSRAGVVVSVREVPGVVAICGDEGPGTAVVVSAVVGLQTGVYPVHKKLKLQVQDHVNQERNH